MVFTLDPARFRGRRHALSKIVTPRFRAVRSNGHQEDLQEEAPEQVDFIRAQPASMSTADVIAKGKAAGIKIGRSLVYMVRSNGKVRKTAAKEAPTPSKTIASSKVTRQAARRATSRKAPSVARPIASSSKAEDLLKAVGAELGLARAIEILQGERARVHAVLRG
ncbi:MAG: hypothetical protein ACRENE_29950 [Polyangiaceae bacterium]